MSMPIKNKPFAYNFLKGISAQFKSAYLHVAFVFISLTIILLSSNVAAQTHNKDYSESKIKTALIYNLLHFINWPSEELLICIYDPGEEYVSSFNAIPSSTKSGNTLSLKFLNVSSAPSAQNDCQVIFISADIDSESLQNILSNAKNNHSVTIGETKQFIKHGGMINFVRRDVNIKFEINASAFEQANLKISSQVLRIADRVYTDNSYE